MPLALYLPLKARLLWRLPPAIALALNPQNTAGEGEHVGHSGNAESDEPPPGSHHARIHAEGQNALGRQQV